MCMSGWYHMSTQLSQRLSLLRSVLVHIQIWTKYSLPTPMLTTATWLPAASCFEYQYMRKNLNVSVLTSKMVKHVILQDPMLYSQFWIWISVVWSIITVGSQVLNRAYFLTWRNTFHHSCPLSPSSKLQFVAEWKRSSTQYFCTLGFMGDKIMRKWNQCQWNNWS